MQRMIRTLGLAGLAAIVSCTGDSQDASLQKPEKNHRDTIPYLAKDVQGATSLKTVDNTVDTIPYLAESVAKFARGFGSRSDATSITFDTSGRNKPQIVGSVYEWVVGKGKDAITVIYTQSDSQLTDKLDIIHASGDFNISDDGLDGFQKLFVKTEAGYQINKIKGDRAEFWQEAELISYTDRDGAVINKNVDTINSKYKEILKTILSK